MECMAPQHCNESGSVTIPGFKVSYSVTCCSDGDMCTPKKPALPPKNNTKNGVFCPACFSKGKCEAKNSMECTGEEKYCVTFQDRLIIMEYTTYGSGCASKDVCPEDRSLHFLKNPYVSTHTYVCSKVSSNTDLKPGHFLRCYICSNNNVENCKDMPSLCSLDEDVCLFEKIRNIYNGKDETEITRRCGKSSECSRAGTITSSTKAILMNTTCCNQTLCHPPVPALPSASHEDNGVICSACFVPNSDRCIGRNNLKCTGEENRCIHYMRTEKKSVLTVTESLYGCATEGICKAGSSKSIPRANYFKTVTTDIVCNSATTWTSKARLVFFFFMTKLICRQYLFEEYNV
ncbi:phospholipase A2 inhibitor and Ly6/PLAUR domain-containing protein-like [Hyperolius riggenbachi]|uniref:phospholipase A2 inhibitor and Ly6/PLAUR domain-containing protein-like n=1 Tax=Hyperolius riggenbachi TaxID=752182 RepID=UPI0035A308D4